MAFDRISGSTDQSNEAHWADIASQAYMPEVNKGIQDFTSDFTFAGMFDKRAPKAPEPTEAPVEQAKDTKSGEAGAFLAFGDMEKLYGSSLSDSSKKAADMMIFDHLGEGTNNVRQLPQLAIAA